MKRPMLWLCVAFVAGMYLVAIFGISVAVTVIFCAFIVFVVKACRTRKLFENVLLFGVWILLVFGMLRYTAASDVCSKSMFPLCGETVLLRGEVAQKPQKSETYVKFFIDAYLFTDDAGNEMQTKERVMLFYFIDEASENPLVIPKKGDVVLAKGTLSLPDSAKNAGGFDYRNYLKTQNIFFELQTEADQVQTVGHREYMITDRIDRFRERCMDFIDQTFPSRESSVLKAYILGDGSEMDEDVAHSFSASGLSHVLAVSGMHVAVFLSILSAVLRLIRVPKRKQLLFILGAVVLYVLFTGASVSAVRAGIVCILSIFALLFFKRSDPLTALSESAAILCFMNPLVILHASFLLSFSATLGILLFGNRLSERMAVVYKRCRKGTFHRKILKTICELTAMGISAQIFTIPILVWLFQSFSTMSVIATLFVTPVLSLLLAGGILFCLVSIMSSTLATPVAGFIFLLTKYMIWVSDLLADFSISQITFGKITPFFLLGYCLAAAVFYFGVLRRNRYGYFVSLYSFAVLLCILLIGRMLSYTTAEVSFINIGQGDCALIQAPGNCDILVDAGGREHDYSNGEEIVKPYLLQKGVYDIEYIFISHGHADHINGVVGLLDVMPVKQIVVPLGFGNTEEEFVLMQKAEEKSVPVTKAGHGDVFRLENGLELMTILPDTRVEHILSAEDKNNHSMLLKMIYGEVSFLFTGDLSKAGELYAVEHYRDFLKADVMKASHHGSKTGNTGVFLDAVEPRFTYIPVGKNSYGFPSKETLMRFTQRDITYYRADIHRDVTLYFDTKRIKGIRSHEIQIGGGLP